MPTGYPWGWGFKFKFLLFCVLVLLDLFRFSTMNSVLKENSINLKSSEIENSVEDVVSRKVRDTKDLEKEIEIVFLDSLPKDLQCRHCDQVLRLPQKISGCGHRVCESCIKGLKDCPECGKEIDHGKVSKTQLRLFWKRIMRCRQSLIVPGHFG